MSPIPTNYFSSKREPLTNDIILKTANTDAIIVMLSPTENLILVYK